MNYIKVMIADDVKETRSMIKKMLSVDKNTFKVSGEASNGEQVLKLIPETEPDVILMDINMPELNGLQAAEKISELYPNIIVIIMSVEGENEYLKKAMYAGAKQYIIKPFNCGDLLNTIQSTYNKHKKIVKKVYSEKKNTKVITFFSTKGGVGKSVLCVNCASILSERLNKKTLLVDTDFQFGDISIMMNKHTEKNIINMIDDNQVGKYESMKQYLYSHNENLDVLFAPKNPDSAEYINKETTEKIISNLKDYYDIVLIDTGVNYSDITLYILDISEIILFITNMDIVSLKNTKLGLGVMNALNYDNNKVKVVLNRVTNKYGIDELDVRKVFKDSIFHKIPEDLKRIRKSLNTGKPVCDEKKYSRTKTVKSINEMCEKLAAG